MALNVSKIDLSSDGVNADFFNLLWTKDELNFGPQINLPDTIVIKQGQPIAWYFTSKNGKVKRKMRQNLMSARIEEAFTKHLLGYDVVATFISTSIAVKDKNSRDVDDKTTMEFLDREGLNHFLYHRGRDTNGLLQRFIEPKGVKNECCRVVWSPKVCMLERSENIHQLHDHRYGLYERCVCFEGPEYYSVSTPLRGPVLAGQIQKACEAIVAHISEVTYSQQQITRAVFNFKVDSRDKLWLMYTTSIRVSANGNPHTLDPTGSNKRTLLNIDSIINIPDSVTLNPVKSYDSTKTKREMIRCISCAKESLDNHRHAITYKSVVKHYEHVLHLVGELAGRHGDRILDWPPNPEVIEAAGNVGFGCLQLVGEYDQLSQGNKIDMNKPLEQDELKIPPLIRYIHPKLTSLNFSRCRKDPLFLYKTVNVCESCYLVYAEFMTMILRLGQDLSKLLKPDPAVVSYIADSSTMTRPSSADWRALSSVNRSISSDNGSLSFQAGSFVSGDGTRSTSPSKNHKKAKKSAIGLRSQDVRYQPEVPNAQRRPPGGLNANSIDSFGTQIQGSPGDFDMPQMGGSSNVADDYDQNNIHQMIAEREKVFFREISLNPQLKNQHPLMHLISAQQKLKMADEQSGVLNSTAGAQKKSLFGTGYGKQAGDSFDRYRVYEVEQPCIIAGQSVLLSKLRREKQLEKIQKAEKKKRKKAKKLKELQAMTGSISTPAMGTVNLEPVDETVDDVQDDDSIDPEEMEMDKAKNKKNKDAAKHYAFLEDTLRKIEGDVVGNNSSSAGGGAKMNDSSDMSPIEMFSTVKSRGTAGAHVNMNMQGFGFAEGGDFTDAPSHLQLPVKSVPNTADSNKRGNLGTADSMRPTTTAEGNRPGTSARPSTTAQSQRGISSQQGTR